MHSLEHRYHLSAWQVISQSFCWVQNSEHLFYDNTIKIFKANILWARPVNLLGYSLFAFEKKELCLFIWNINRTLNIAATNVTGPHAKLKYLVNKLCKTDLNFLRLHGGAVWTAWRVPRRLLQLEQPNKMLDIEHLVPTHTRIDSRAHTRTHTRFPASVLAHMHVQTHGGRHAQRHTHTPPTHTHTYNHMYVLILIQILMHGRPKG